MAHRRRQIGPWTVAALVLLRLAIGWHFFSEGVHKLSYDASEGRFRIAFSAEPFLSQATGPLAGWFHDYVPNNHDWPTLLAVPRQDTPSQSPAAPGYQDWAEKISSDWKTAAEKIGALSGLSEDQRQALHDALGMRQKQLDDYLAGEAAAIKDYQHELWRLAEMRSAPEAAGLPYEQERIASKSTELSRTPKKWVDQVAEFEQSYFNDLRNIVTDKQQADPQIASVLEESLNDPRAVRLQRLNWTVTYLLLGVGACLLVGFFTRLVSLAGAAFVLSVIASQPPWVPDAVPTYFCYQCVELMSLLVLFTVGAGRWFGLDRFTYAVWHRLFGSGAA